MVKIPTPLLYSLNQALRSTTISISGSSQTLQMGQFAIAVGRNDLSITYAGQFLDVTARLIDKGGDETGLIPILAGHGRFYVPIGDYIVQIEL